MTCRSSLIVESRRVSAQVLAGLLPRLAFSETAEHAIVFDPATRDVHPRTFDGRGRDVTGAA